MIIAQLTGGLGNQMFQYAAGRALAHRHRSRLYVDLTHYATDPLRRYELPNLKITADVATPAMLRLVRARLRRGREHTFYNFISRMKVYLEPHFHVDPQFFALPDHRFLVGYFASAQYFEEIAGLIRAEFEVKEPLAGENLALAAEIRSGPSVSVHVRRGDYAVDPAIREIHGLMPIEYYNRAIAHVRTRVGRCRAFVFSDDPDWAMEHLQLPDGATVVSHNAGRGHEDMRLMAMCEHHVIANSTFSWWAAWLNPRADKVVVAPAKWFGSAPHDTKDLTPPEWIRL